MVTLQEIVEYLKSNGEDIFAECSTPEPINTELVESYIMLRCGLMTPVYSEPNLFKIQTKMWFSKMQWEFDKLVKILLAEYDPIDNVTETINTTEMHSGTDKRKFGGKDTLFHGEIHTLSGMDTLTHGETHTLSGNDTLTHGETHTLSGTDTNTDTTSTAHNVSAYNSSGYQADSQDVNSGSVTTTHGKTDTASGDDVTEYGKTDTASGDDTQEYGKTDDFTHGERVETRMHRHGNIGVVSPDDLIERQLDLLERFNVYDWIARKFERDNMIQVY